MSRVIKFRVWDKNENTMIIPGFISNSPEWNEEKGRVLIQYTGLKDKNGKEIYEGDIIEFVWEEDSCWGKEGTYKGFIRYCDGRYEVVYINRQEYTPTKDGGKHPNSKSDELQSFIKWTDKQNIEVIGNIYENPLLEEQHE